MKSTKGEMTIKDTEAEARSLGNWQVVGIMAEGRGKVDHKDLKQMTKKMIYLTEIDQSSQEDLLVGWKFFSFETCRFWSSNRNLSMIYRRLLKIQDKLWWAFGTADTDLVVMCKGVRHKVLLVYETIKV